MRFTIPQFIEHEPKIVGPLTFKQFIYIGLSAAICFVLYFLAPRFLFYIACALLLGLGSALAFMKIGNIPLPTLLLNFFKYSFKPKIYLWKKGEIKQEEFNERVVIKKEGASEDELPLKVEGKSRLKDMKIKVETKQKKT